MKRKSGIFDSTRFEAEVDELVQAPFRLQPPKVLYHYTRWAALESILRSQEVRGTAHCFTNDPAEFQSIDAMILDIARALVPNTSGLARTLLCLFIREFSRQRLAEHFVGYLTCFSAARDKAIQWQRYADEGRGVCIGFKVLDGESLPLLTDGSMGRGLFQVDYDLSSWQRRLADAFRSICDKIRSVTTRDGEVRKQVAVDAGSAFFRIAAFASTCAKRSEWKEEEEWRHVALLQRFAAHPGIAGSGIVRTMDLRFRTAGRLLAIEEIIVGGNQEPRAAELRASELLRRSGYPDASAALPAVRISGES